jgi:hypothetical protein
MPLWTGMISSSIQVALASSVVILLSLTAASQHGGDGHAGRRLASQSGVLWEPYQSWTIRAPAYDGNPFDAVATVVFLHLESEDQHTTQMFYDGDGTWEFRFTGTRVGEWQFQSSSEHEAFDGWHGSIDIAPNPEPDAVGFLTARGTRFAVPTDEEGAMEARLYNVYMNHALKDSLDDYSSDLETLDFEMDEILDEVEEHGLDALFVAVNNNWFAFGSNGHHEHDSQDPSLETFLVLETLILRARHRGLSVHIWKWGDEDRRWTPIGVGGINGPPDRRLQRYIAARLGPLPGWTMSYGFDLHEWVTEEEVRSWWQYMHHHLGWPRLLMARESSSHSSSPFDMGDDKLDVFSTDEKKESLTEYYHSAAEKMATYALPLLYERRFLHTRDGTWDMETTRRAIWQFTMAGGAAGVWGVLWGDGPPYPEPAQLRTHSIFWRDRFGFDLSRTMLLGSDRAFALRDEKGSRAVVYAEAASTIRLARLGLTGPQSVIAVDTTAPYGEIELGIVHVDEYVWSAPYESDWALAVGSF